MSARRPDTVTLTRLAAAVRAAREDPRGAALAPLLALAGTLGPDEAVTVDLRACDQLGHPLVVVRTADEPAPPAAFALLTAREREVVALVADGLSNAAIARRLRISVATTKDHVHHALAKTGYRRRTQLVAAWLMAGRV